ncbi:MAG: DUF4465 domain-containing protein [Bacteroidales bacterium]|nr:DUF4465 domain-containing protein [Bacteroidales bacterium]
MKKSFRIFALAAVAALALTACDKGPKTVTLDFEGSKWDALVDSPQYGGPLLYGTQDLEYYTWTVDNNYTWSDGTTMLEFPGFPESWGSICFSSGGEVISNYVVADYKDAGFTRQLEVPVAPKSGKNFAVHYGSADPTAKTKKISSTPIYSQLLFSDGVERVIKSIDVCLTNYVLNSCVNGDGYFGPMTSSETALYIKAIGFDAYGTATKVATVKIIDGSDAAAYKAGSKKPAWKTWDLSGLGAVGGIMFCVYGTDDCYGEYGFNAPAYFAYDNIVVEYTTEE